jgi:hypothetical protein
MTRPWFLLRAPSDHRSSSQMKSFGDELFRLTEANFLCYYTDPVTPSLGWEEVIAKIRSPFIQMGRGYSQKSGPPFPRREEGTPKIRSPFPRREEVTPQNPVPLPLWEGVRG